MHPATDADAQRTRRDGLAALGLAVLAFAAFMPALSCEFVNYDDPQYVTKNPQVKSGLNADGARWAFTTFDAANWHPLTWLSLQLDASLWTNPEGGLDPRGFHLTNVLLHAANAALLFLALRSLTGAFWRSAAVALLFAVHPLRAESVAWVAERKDVLSALFGFAALWAYAGYATAPSVRRYLLTAAPFALSLLAKPMLVTLPCLLLVLDWWPLGRARAPGDWRRLAAEKLPVFALVAASAAVTLRAQAAGGAVKHREEGFTPAARVENAAVSYAAYLTKTAWPANLSVHYPHPVYNFDSTASLLPAKAAGAALMLVAVTAGAVALRRRAPYLLAGWLWYVGTLVPVIGLVQVGGQAMADRYTYLSQIGLLIAACWGAADLAGTWRRAALAAGALAAAALAAVTQTQLAVWHDSFSLWDHARRVSGESPAVMVNLGEVLEQRGKLEGAARCYEGAMRLDPNTAQIRLDLGNALQGLGKFDEAARQFEEACRLAPDAPLGYSNLGNLLLRQGRLDEAARQFEEARKRDPDMAEIPYNLGLVAEARKDYAGAAEFYHEALRLRPDYPKATAQLGFVLTQAGQVEEGLARLREAERADPRSAQVHYLLGQALERQNDLAAAADHFERAAALSPRAGGMWLGLGRVRFRQGRLPEAVEWFGKAVMLEPGNTDFAQALAVARRALEQSNAGRPAGTPPAPGR
jgi:tetratricopeptide (TPR) repeat protein